jgi:hypothetical protein
MNINKLLLPLLAAAGFMAANLTAGAAPIRVLIVDGQNNHKWAETTPLLKSILERAGIFTVAVTTTPPAGPKPPTMPKNATAEQKAAHAAAVKAFAAAQAAHAAKSAALWDHWRPHFSDYDVIVSNYNGEDWPVEARRKPAGNVSTVIGGREEDDVGATGFTQCGEGRGDRCARHHRGGHVELPDDLGAELAGLRNHFGGNLTPRHHGHGAAVSSRFTQ